MVIVIPGQKVLSAHLNAKLDKDNSDEKPTADFRPETTNLYTLGSSALRWKELFLGTLASDPVSPVEGEVWYNTTDKQYKGYDGSDIVILG